MKKAIVTGATGCIGRNLVDILERDDWEITILHRKSSDLSRLKGCKVKAVETNFYDQESVLQAIPENADVIFHIAANLSHDPRENDLQWLDNVLATKNLAEAALIKKVGRFIFTSTGATDAYFFKGEEDCEKIKDGYVRTKRLSELELYKCIPEGLDFVILQPGIVIGRYDYNNYSQIFQLIEAGKLSRTFAGNFIFGDAEHIAQAHLNAFYKGKKREHYSLGGVFSSWVDLSNTAARLMGLKVNVKATPYPILKLVSYFLFLYAKLTHKKALLTPQIVDLVGQGVNDMNLFLKNKSKEDLGFDGKLQSMEKMVKSCLDWMQKEGMLSKNFDTEPIKNNVTFKEINNINNQSNNFNHGTH